MPQVHTIHIKNRLYNPSNKPNTIKKQLKEIKVQSNIRAIFGGIIFHKIKCIKQQNKRIQLPIVGTIIDFSSILPTSIKYCNVLYKEPLVSR